MKKTTVDTPITKQILQKELLLFEKRLKIETLNLEKRLEKKLDQKLEQKLEEKFEEKMDKYTGKVYNLIDAVLVEIKEIRDEHATTVKQVPVMRNQLENHEERIEKVELAII